MYLEPPFGAHFIDFFFRGLTRHLHPSKGTKIFDRREMHIAHRLGDAICAPLPSTTSQWVVRSVLSSDAFRRGEFE